MAAVYVSGFDYDTDENTLSKHFRSVGAIKDLYFQSKGGAVITFVKEDAARRAVSELHETTMKGQERYVSVKLDEPRGGKGSGKGKGSKGKGYRSGSDGGSTAIFVRGFDLETTDEASLRKHFGKVGKIEDLYFQSKTSAVITFSKEDAAERAISELHESYIKGQDRYVEVKLDDRNRSKGAGKGRAVFVHGFDFDTDEDAVRKHFGKAGTIEHLHFQSRGAAVVEYSDESAALRAVNDLDGSTMSGQSRWVGVKLDDRGKGSGKGKSRW